MSDWVKVGQGTYTIQPQGLKGARITIPKIWLDQHPNIKHVTLWWRAGDPGLLIMPGDMEPYR